MSSSRRCVSSSTAASTATPHSAERCSATRRTSRSAWVRARARPDCTPTDARRGPDVGILPGMRAPARASLSPLLEREWLTLRPHTRLQATVVRPIRFTATP
eukprot:scaffold270_cov121-Isochrysis_galbana.AAC.29